MRKRQPAVSHSSSSLNGLFRDVYAKKMCDMIPEIKNVIYDDHGTITKRPGVSLFDINKATYSLWNSETSQHQYQVLVNPVTYKNLMEDTMGTCDTDKPCEESAVTAELNHLKYRVKELRDGIARKQEQLRIELAKLAAVKKLAKGGK